MSVLIALLLGIPIGVLSAVKHNSVIDLIGRVLALLGSGGAEFSARHAA